MGKSDFEQCPLPHNKRTDLDPRFKLMLQIVSNGANFRWVSLYGPKLKGALAGHINCSAGPSGALQTSDATWTR